MNKIKKVFYYWIFPASFCSLLAAFAMAAIAQAGKVTETTPVLTLSGLSLISAFCFLITLATCIFRVKKLSFLLKLLIHFIGCIVSFALTFLVVGGYYKNGKGAFYILMLAVIIYFIIMAICLAVRAIIRATDKDDEKYESQF